MKRVIILLIAFAGIADAQTTNSNSLVGLPEAGVTLMGSPDKPVVEKPFGQDPPGIGMTGGKQVRPG